MPGTEGEPAAADSASCAQPKILRQTFAAQEAEKDGTEVETSICRAAPWLCTPSEPHLRSRAAVALYG